MLWLVFERCEPDMKGEGEGRPWTYHWVCERSNGEREEENDGSEFETEHGED